MTEHDDSLLAAEYALGLLDKARAAEFEQRLQNEPELRSYFLSWSEHFAALYNEVREVTPPSSLKPRIQKRLFTSSIPDVEQTQPKSSPWFRPVAWISSLLLVALLGFFFYQSQQTLFQAEYTASLETADQSLQVTANYDETRNLLRVSAIKAIPATGRTYELWLIAGDNPPVSLGVVENINNKDVALTEELAAVIVGSTLAISDEPVGGSPTGSPTGEVLTTATVTKL